MVQVFRTRAKGVAETRETAMDKLIEAIEGSERIQPPWYYRLVSWE